LKLFVGDELQADRQFFMDAIEWDRNGWNPIENPKHLSVHTQTVTQEIERISVQSKESLMAEPRFLSEFAAPDLFRAKYRKVFSQCEDDQLAALVAQFGTSSWGTVAKYMRTRTARQCRDRWNHYISPTVNLNPWTAAEDKLLFAKYHEIGGRWSVLCQFFSSRTLNNVKNRWNSLMRKLRAIGLDADSEKDFLYCGELISRAGGRIDLPNVQKSPQQVPTEPLPPFDIRRLLNRPVP
jgi:hypothetical protein